MLNLEIQPSAVRRAEDLETAVQAVAEHFSSVRGAGLGFHRAAATRCRSRHQEPDPDNAVEAGACRGWWPRVVWNELLRHVSASRRPSWTRLKGAKPTPAGRATDQVRAGRQPPDRANARAGDKPGIPSSCRRHHRIEIRCHGRQWVKLGPSTISAQCPDDPECLAILFSCAMRSTFPLPHAEQSARSTSTDGPSRGR